MANIPIRDITQTGIPTATSNIVFDDGSMKKATVADLADGVRPVASQSEAQTGSDNSKTMSPLRVKQSIASEVGVTVASKSQGDAANTALQPAAIGSTVQAYDADLAAISGLSPANNDILQRKSGAWVNRTPAQVKADLSLSTVATSGSYNDLTDQPTIPAAGVPSGGTTGQVLGKTSGSDYAVTWVDTGAGDMIKASYDPTDVHADAFDSVNTKFNQIGPDPTTRPVESKLREVRTPGDFGAKGDGVTGYSGVCTASSTTFTDANAAFTSDDVGKAILITGGGASQARLLTTIAAVVSATSITLADAASTSINGTFYSYGHDDTDALVKLAAAYNTLGVSVHFPDTGAAYLCRADQVTFAPPPSYNFLNRTPPAITCDHSACVMAISGGAYLMRLGTDDSDYSGLLRGGYHKPPILDANNFPFTDGALYLPFFLDIYMDCKIFNAVSRYLKLGSTDAPASSAGLKGWRWYERQMAQWRRDSVSITNAVNPVVTFATPHGLWPTSGRRCMAMSFIGSPSGWNAIAGKSLDINITSATTVQILNVDSTSFGTFSGTAVCHLNVESQRISKPISGVTNANPTVVTTSVPHLLTTGDTVDISMIAGIPELCGQYTATVTSSTTFSIPVDRSAATTGYNTFGWAMQWVPFEDCDIGEFHQRSTDIDDTNMYVKHCRVGVYADPDFSGWDGKHVNGHFYSFPETCEILCAYRLGGNNTMTGVQVDGPFKHAFWFFASGNVSTGCNTNLGAIDGKDGYGTLGRVDSSASWVSQGDSLKGAPSARMYSDFCGTGSFTTDGTNTYSSVYSPQIEYGPGKRAAAIVMDMRSDTPISAFQAVNSARTTGGAAQGDRIVSFVRPVPLECYLETACAGDATTPSLVQEDITWVDRSVFQRRIISMYGGSPVDLQLVSATWRYP